MIDLSVLVVCYKSKDLVLETLEGLYRHTSGVEFEVLLTDCSQDGVIDLVKSQFPQVTIVPTEENLGFARGNNFLAQRANGERILLLNPDVLIHDNAVGKLVDCSKEFPNAGAWGGMTILPDGRIDPGSQQTYPNWSRLLRSALGLGSEANPSVHVDMKSPVEVDGLSGAFMMLSRTTWAQMGGFDESFFMYAEELDLCYRIRNSGKPIVLDPRSRVTHLVGSGSGLSPKRRHAIAKAKMHFVRKHESSLQVQFFGLALWFYALTRAVGGSFKSFLKSDRGRKLAESNWPLVRQPTTWWHGYR